MQVLRERALEEAQEAERAMRSGEAKGPLHGIPFGVKDIYHVAGVPTRAGSASWEVKPSQDAVAVSRLRRTGAILLGKTTTTVFAFRDPAPTRNPWNPAHTPGGSSSGSAAAVAARMVPLALGTQTAGSLSRPASYCGVVAPKLTYGLVSRRGVVPLAWSLDHVGAFTLTVEDQSLANQDQVSVLTGGQRSNLVVQVQGPGAVHGGELQHVPGRRSDGLRRVPLCQDRFVDPRSFALKCELHLRKHVAAGGSDHIDAQGRPTALGEQPADRRVPMHRY